MEKQTLFDKKKYLQCLDIVNSNWAMPQSKSKAADYLIDLYLNKELPNMDELNKKAQSFEDDEPIFGGEDADEEMDFDDENFDEEDDLEDYDQEDFDDYEDD